MPFLFLFFFFAFANAGEWANQKDDLSFLRGEIEYSNRSSCAKKSLRPTRSVFLLLDNVNLAKSVYRLAKIKKMDPVATTNLGIEKFRYTIAELIKIISSKLLSGDLNYINDKELSDDYLAASWAKSRMNNLGQYIQCHVIKKISMLHSNLTSSRPDRAMLEELAKQLQHSEDYLTNCSDFSDVSQPEVALLQFNLHPDQSFEEKGFAFWYSLKVYLSWAFRQSSEMHKLAQPFDFLFQSLNLEEMLVFFSNGCESITPANCSDKDLSLDNLRFLTQHSSTIDWSNSNTVKPVPTALPDEMYSRPIPLREEDLLNLGKYNTADEWALNFRDNFVRSRGYNKIKLSKSLSHLAIITQNTSVEEMTHRMQKDIDSLPHRGKQELYYLCSEYSVAFEKDLSFVRRDLQRLKKVSALDESVKIYSESKIEGFLDFLDKLSIEVNHICEELKQKNIWDKDFELKKEGFAPWYQQLVFEKKYSLKDGLALTYEVSDRPFLSIQKGAVICQNGLHCSRLVLDSLMSLSAISHVFSSLVPESSIPSTNMANPYATAMACGAYDPWAKRNKIIFDFFQDMAQAALFSYLPTPIYVGASLDPRRVVSFETLVQEGEVFYDPKFNHNRLKLSLLADLGPLIGVPCSVSISGSKMNPFEYYMFNGISFSGCRERTKTDVVIQSGDNQAKVDHTLKTCAACALNLQTVSASASLINPVFRLSFFLVKGVTRLISQLKDPNDLSRNVTISPQQVALSYRYHGEISKKCAKRLLRRKSCLEKKCERRMMEEFTSRFFVSPVSTKFSCLKAEGKVYIKECKLPIYLSGRKITKVETKCHLKERQ